VAPGWASRPAGKQCQGSKCGLQAQERSASSALMRSRHCWPAGLPARRHPIAARSMNAAARRTAPPCTRTQHRTRTLCPLPGSRHARAQKRTGKYVITCCNCGVPPGTRHQKPQFAQPAWYGNVGNEIHIAKAHRMSASGAQSSSRRSPAHYSVAGRDTNKEETRAN
jgi:hypothetical protein